MQNNATTIVFEIHEKGMVLRQSIKRRRRKGEKDELGTMERLLSYQ